MDKGKGEDHEPRAEGKKPFAEDEERQEVSEDNTALEVQKDPRQTMVKVRPRSSPAVVRSNVPVMIDLNMLQSKLHMRRAQAAKSLNISETALKQACRKLGIASWPRRQLPNVVDDATRREKAKDNVCAQTDCGFAGRQELKRERGWELAGGPSSASSNPESSEGIMSSAFLRLQRHGEKEEEMQSDTLESGSSSRPHQRRLLSDTRPAHASSNMPAAASSRVSFEEELTRVAAFPPLRDLLGTPGAHTPALTASPEKAGEMTSRPAREAVQGEGMCELDSHAPLRRPSTVHDEFTLLQNIQVYLSYPPLCDLLQTSPSTG
jgi:hypothetical protein